MLVLIAVPVQNVLQNDWERPKNVSEHAKIYESWKKVEKCF